MTTTKWHDRPQNKAKIKAANARWHEKPENKAKKAAKAREKWAELKKLKKQREVNITDFEESRIEKHPQYGYFVLDGCQIHYFNERKKYERSKVNTNVCDKNNN